MRKRRRILAFVMAILMIISLVLPGAGSSSIQSRAEGNASEEEGTSERDVLTFDGTGFSVKLYYTGEAGIPEGSSLQARKLIQGTDEYEDYLNRVMDGLGDTAEKNKEGFFVDITILNSDGEEVEPAAPVKVDIHFDQPVEVSDPADTTMVHFAESGMEEVPVGTDRSGETVSGISFDTDSFSVYGFIYTVDFTYDGYTFSMPGSTDMLLSELFTVLGIDASVADVIEVTFTDDSLLKVEQQAGDWLLTSLAPFSSDEMLTVKLSDGTKYLLNVTDAVSTNLNDFITDVNIQAPKNDLGQYLVSPGEPYQIKFNFKETYTGPDNSIQFPSDGSSMTYTFPQGVVADDINKGLFNITVNFNNTNYVVRDNRYSIANGVMTVAFNASDPNFDKLNASAFASFGFNVTGRFGVNGDNTTSIKFTDELEKEIYLDTSNSVETAKSAVFDKDNGKINYTVSVKSTGKSENVTLHDRIAGSPAGLVSLDVSSLNVTSSTGNPVSVSGGISGNELNYTIPEMKNDEIITFTYSADVDVSSLTSVDGKYSGFAQNDVSVKSDGDPDGDTATVKTNIDYTPSIAKSEGQIAVTDAANKKYYVDWTITANENPVVSMGGTTITDTIPDGSSGIMKYAEDGLTIERYDASNQLVGTESVSWDSLLSKSDSSWAYKIPDTDPAYKYLIKYRTEVNSEGQTSSFNVTNNVTTSSGKGASGGKSLNPIGGEVILKKELENVDLDNMEISWKISFNVPEDGLNKAVVEDIIENNIWVDNHQLFEHVKDGSISITGLLAEESYVISDNGENKVITFYKDNAKTTPGLLAEARTVEISLKTEINPDRLEASKKNSWMKTHNNTVKLTANNSEKTTSASATVETPSIAKTVSPSGTRTVDGTELPIYKYEIVLSNVTSDVNEIEDTYDTTLLEPYFDANMMQYNTAWHICGGSIDYQGNKSNNTVAFIYTPTGLKFTTSAETMPHDASSPTGFYDRYRLEYYLTVKNKTALYTLNEMAAAVENGKYTIQNTAEWEGMPFTAETEFTYDALSKEILTADLKKTDEDIFADFRINVNPSGMMMNNGDDMRIVDTVNNLSVDLQSINVSPARDDVTWNMTGYDLVFNVPDGVALTITYRAKVMMSKLPESGASLSIPISNKVELFRGDTGEFGETVSRTAEYTNSGSGRADVPMIHIMKCEDGNMTKRLPNAVFQLLDENKDPLTDPDGNNLIFITGSVGDEKGIATVYGDHTVDGWSLVADTRYYLREIKAPEGYKLSGVDYAFSITEDGTTDYDNFIYHSGDTMLVRDELGADVVVNKTWSNGNANHASDNVIVKLQQKIGDGSYSDIIRKKNGADWEDAYSAENPWTVTLNAGNQWKATFADVPATVPESLPANVGDEYVAVDYRVVEISVNGTAPDAASVSYDRDCPNPGVGGTFTFNITNTAKAVGDLNVSKVLVSDLAADADQSFGFTVTLGDTSINGTYGDVTFIDGVATFNLKGGETKSAVGLPKGVTYTVAETEETNFTTSKTGDTGSISDTAATAEFTNTRKTGDLTVTKTVVSSTAADKTKNFSFTVTLDDTTISGTYGGMTFTNGVATFTLKDTESKTATGLPTSVGYTVA
ncbi:MAG: hypothetical protein IJM25_03750, partial [Eubacterium sp.]|nr:hypothetical protein [Eubacterium sp.]